MPSVFGDPEAKPALREQTLNHPLVPTELTLADGTHAVAFPLTSQDYIPLSLLTHLTDEFNEEIERGQTYPLESPLTPEGFKTYWMGDFTAIVLKGTLAEFEKTAASQHAVPGSSASVTPSDPSHLYENYHEEENAKSTHAKATALIPRDADWGTIFLGTFHVLPNYPGRSSHVCNCGFLVSSLARGSPLKVGSAMGKLYLEWAPKLGYTYSVYNLVYETNEYSVRIWENLGFERIGRVPGAGILKGYDKPVDAIIFGKQLV
ncbi:uncharacterized protein SAPINGB_P001783 [Magnusiomyces paraingens]|uniref:N-acetyltransferase domain-containing protein n=1 Tax=Magnusiomyces paraingens TaxID=2606893 RepID=A0A5E8BBG3_9ASCO|nr:uncharacterized protein SAPINGB_P001783 [Saprochaete ingens]VVT48446.1 unnamed protein product [Saprochaete ingens]